MDRCLNTTRITSSLLITFSTTNVRILSATSFLCTDETSSADRSLDIRERTNLPIAVRDNGLQWNTRVDFTPSSKDRFYGNYYRKTPDVLGPNPRPAFNQLNNFSGITNYANLDWTHTFSPTLVND